MTEKKQLFPPALSWKYLDFLFFLIYAGVLLYMLPFHEPWSDEVQPWLLARDMSIGELARAMLMNYDRHPGLWYFVMHAIAAMKFTITGAAYANLLFCLTAAALYLFKAPFPRWFKYAFLCSYYMIYEYPLLARHYSLTFLLMTAIAALYARRHERPLLFTGLIFLLFNAAYITLGFTCALAACYTVEFLRRTKKSTAGWLSLGILTAGFVLVMLQGGMLPPDHVDYGTPNLTRPYAQNFFMFKTLFPYPGALTPGVEILISAGVALILVLALLPAPFALFMLLCGYTLLAYIFKFHHWGDLRHYGFFIHISLFALWIRSAYQHEYRLTLPRWPEAALRNIVFAATALAFISSAPFTWTVMKMEKHFEFSGGKWMAGQIQSMYDHFGLHDKGMTIIAHPHTRVVSVITHLPDMSFWIPGLNRSATYYLNTKEMASSTQLKDAEVLETLETRFPDLSRVLLLLDHPLEQTTTQHVRYIPLIDMTQVPVHGYVRERFYLYKPVLKES